MRYLHSPPLTPYEEHGRITVTTSKQLYGKCKDVIKGCILTYYGWPGPGTHTNTSTTAWAAKQNLVSQRVEEVLMLITALFTRVNIWAQPMTDEWIKTNVHMHNECYLAI